MSAKALLARNPAPDGRRGARGLTGNLCRCSDYNHYVDAVAGGAATAEVPRCRQQRTRSRPHRAADDCRPCQRRASTPSSASRGKATYTSDVKLPGMLYARVLRSPHPHARIRRIDTSKALALPGVKAILTHENCKVVWGAGRSRAAQQYNDEIKKITKHRRYVFNNPVRFVGEPVAAVAAVDRHIAEEALQLIAVDYEVAAVRARSGRGAEAGASRSGPKAISRRTRATRRSR